MRLGSQAGVARNHGALVSTSRQEAVAHQQLRTPTRARRSRDTRPGSRVTAPTRPFPAAFRVGPVVRAALSRVTTTWPSSAQANNPRPVSSCRRRHCRGAAWIRDDGGVQPSLGAYPRLRHSLLPVLTSARSGSCRAGHRARAPWFGTRTRIPVYSMKCSQAPVILETARWGADVYRRLVAGAA